MGVFIPFFMDSLIPFIELRYNVSCMAFQSASEIITALARLPVITIGLEVLATSSISEYSLFLARVEDIAVMIILSFSYERTLLRTLCQGDYRQIILVLKSSARKDSIL